MLKEKLRACAEKSCLEFNKEIKLDSFEGLLVDYATEKKANGIIRGLRNGHDLQYETNLLYWNEDLGLSCPIVYFICDRSLSHISSSMVKEVNKLKKNGN